MNDTPPLPVASERLATGISGLDELSGGGLPAGETTLLCGTTGTGKSVLGLQFLAAGILEFDQPAVFVTFEQSPDQIRHLAASFGWDVVRWERQGDWAFVDASPSEEQEVVIGEQFNIEPLIARIVAAVQRTAAKRVVLDTLTVVLSRLGDATSVRSELHRVILTLDALGVTAIITAERDMDYGQVTRYGVEEFVASSVLILRYVLHEEHRRRTIEVLKFRGMDHGDGEFPFVITADRGLVFIVLSQIALTHPSSNTRTSIGTPELDAMCGGGAFQTSITLASGATGTGKTLLGVEFLTAGDEHDRALLIAFEESPDQIARNAHGWGHDLGALQASGRLLVHCRYASSATLERHLVQIIDLIDEYRPTRLVIDGLSGIEHSSTSPKAFEDFVRGLSALVKERQIASFFTIARPLFDVGSSASFGVSTLLDTIILLRFVEIYGELHRGIAVLKMRGSDHDKRIRELTIGPSGSQVGAPFRTTTGIISGSALQLLGAENIRVEALFTGLGEGGAPQQSPDDLP